MARLMGYFVRGETRPLTVLVATSGDTGSAVAHGFLRVPGIRVVILYPSKRISEAQEKQFTDRKSTRLNSSHLVISYAVFCLKKKKKTDHLQNICRTHQ